MLVLHPSSRCDVCLDAYEDGVPGRSPHAIPCGHTFCKPCLDSVVPPNCPLCRKPFVPDRSKKLHVDQPESLEDHTEIDLLQRLILSWEEPEEHQVEVTTEVETWLRNRHDEASIPLRRAREALAQYQRLTTRKEQDRRKISQLQATLEENQQSALQERMDARRIEENFATSMSELQSQVSQFQSEIEALQAELAKYKHTKNPLPPPPEPVSFDHLPTFRNPQFLDPQSSYPLLSITNGTSTELYPNGYIPARTGDENIGSDSQHRSERRPKYDIYPTYAPSRHSNGADVSAPLQRHGIIPGASPNHRVIPTVDEPLQMGEPSSAHTMDPPRSPSPLLDPVRDGVDPYTVTGEYLQQFAAGWSEGYQAAFPPAPASAAPMPSGRSTRSSNTIASSSASTQNGGIYDMGALNNSLLERPRSDRDQWYPSSTQSTDRRSRRGRSGERPTLHQSQSEFSTAPSSSDLNRDSDRYYRRPNQPRRTTTQGVNREHVTTTTEVLSNPTAAHAPRANRASTGSQQSLATGGANGASVNRRSTRESMGSSWGTVSTGIPDWQSTGHGSLSDLGLRTFSGRAHIDPAASDSSLPFSANPFGSRRNEESATANLNPRTPMVRTMESPWPATAPPLAGFPGLSSAPGSSGRNSRANEGRYSAFPPTPSMQVLSAPQGSQHTQSIVIPEEEGSRGSSRRHHRTRRDSSRHHSRRRPPTVTSSTDYNEAPLQSAPPLISSESAGYLTGGPVVLPTSGVGNALGLDLALEQPRSPQISAPTPRVSSHAFLRSFSSDAYS